MADQYYKDPATGVTYTSKAVFDQYNPTGVGGQPGTPTLNPDPQPGSLQGTMTQTQPTTPSQPTQSASNQGALSSVMLALEDRYKANNDLMTNRNIALNALYGMKTTPEDLNKLDPTLRQALQSGDKNQIEMQIRLINDQVSGRANTLDQSMQFLTNQYAQQQQQIEKQRQDSISTVLDFVKTYGSNAKQALTSLYGQQYIDQLKSQGIDLDKFANISSIDQISKGIAPTALTGNPVGNISGLQSFDTAAANPGMNRPDRNNNPGNIKVSEWSKNLPGVIGVESRPSTDGGNFLIFDSPQSGMNAIGALLQQGSSYKGVTAEQAMKKYSGGGYGASAVGLDPTMDFQSQIADSATLDSVVQAIAKREGFTGAQSTASSTGLSPEAIDLAAQQYLVTGQMPSLGLGSAPQVRAARSAILNRAAELGSGMIPGVNKAQLSAQTAALKQQTQYAATIERSINTVEANIKILQEAASKVSNYQSPLLNEWQRLAQSKVIGSGDLAAYTTALQTVRTEYATILGRGTATDQTRSDAARLIPDNLSRAQLDQVIATIEREGQNVVNAANAQVDQIQGQMQNILGGTTPTTPPTSSGSYEDYLKAIGQAPTPTSSAPSFGGNGTTITPNMPGLKFGQ